MIIHILYQNKFQMNLRLNSKNNTQKYWKKTEWGQKTGSYNCGVERPL